MSLLSERSSISWDLFVTAIDREIRETRERDRMGKRIAFLSPVEMRALDHDGRVDAFVYGFSSITRMVVEDRQRAARIPVDHDPGDEDADVRETRVGRRIFNFFRNPIGPPPQFTREPRLRPVVDQDPGDEHARALPNVWRRA